MLSLLCVAAGTLLSSTPPAAEATPPPEVSAQAPVADPPLEWRAYLGVASYGFVFAPAQPTLGVALIAPELHVAVRADLHMWWPTTGRPGAIGALHGGLMNRWDLRDRMRRGWTSDVRGLGGLGILVDGNSGAGIGSVLMVSTTVEIEMAYWFSRSNAVSVRLYGRMEWLLPSIGLSAGYAF